MKSISRVQKFVCIKERSSKAFKGLLKVFSITLVLASVIWLPFNLDLKLLTRINSSNRKLFAKKDMKHVSGLGNKMKPQSPTLATPLQADTVKNLTNSTFSIASIINSITSANDFRLLQVIQDEFLIEPSTKQYNLTDKKHQDPSVGQANFIFDTLGKMKNGRFIECGAYDGEKFSNTLYMERFHNWTGVLIEASPKNFKKMQYKHRKAWTVHACLSDSSIPEAVLFHEDRFLGKIITVEDLYTGRPTSITSTSHVYCLPIISILLALNMTRIDYFSLDVEGKEFDVLKTIPWDQVNITTLSIEVKHGPHGKKSIGKYMEDQGYRTAIHMVDDRGFVDDLIFYHPTLLANTLNKT